MTTPSTMAYTFVVLLGLIGGTGAVTAVHAEDPFNGHRLFFTEAQRKNAARIGTDVSVDSLPDASTQGLADADADNDRKRVASTGERANAGSVDPLDTRQRPLSPARIEESANNYQVYFTGLVTGIREPRVLVNGLPCEPVSAERSGKSGQHQSIDCHGVRNDGLMLIMLTTSGELLVTDQDGRVHHLSPGEGM